MNVILAQLRKDVLTQRFLLLAWALCSAFNFIIPFFHINPVGSASLVGQAVLGIGLLGGIYAAAGVQFLLLAILAARIIQEDPLVGTEVFWRTRPVSRARLLAEKLLLIATLYIVTIFTCGPLSLQSHDYAFPFFSLIFILSFVAFASVTVGFVELILTFLGVGIVAEFFSILMYFLRNFRLSKIVHETQLQNGTVHSYNYNLSSDAASVPSAGVDWVSLVLIACLVAIIVHQYLTTRTKRSLLFLFLALLLTSLLKQFLPVN
ncbi:MAG: hypothetical protein ABI443_06550 [Chthoniobacterales bacterium]